MIKLEGCKKQCGDSGDQDEYASSQVTIAEEQKSVAR